MSKKQDLEYLITNGSAPPRKERTPQRKTYKEHSLQVRCVQRFRYEHPDIAHLLIAIPNGGKRSTTEAKWLKAEGMTPGASDLILLVSRGAYGFLCIESKTTSKDSRQSEAQKEWQKLVEQNGGKYIIYRDADTFWEIVTKYLNLKENETF